MYVCTLHTSALARAQAKRKWAPPENTSLVKSMGEGYLLAAQEAKQLRCDNARV